MRSYQDFSNIDCKVYHLHNITEDLFQTRENFCKEDCKNCIIHKKYYHLGYSCNTALNKFKYDCFKEV